MSVKLAGGETYSFHGNNTGEGSEFLIPKQHRRGFRISDPSNNTGVSEFLFPPHTKGEDTEFLNPQTTQVIQNF